MLGTTVQGASATDRGAASVRFGRAASTLAAVAIFAATVAACGETGGTDPNGPPPNGPPSGEEDPVSWAAVVAPPGSFDGYSCGLTVGGRAYCWGIAPGVGDSRRPIPVPGGYTFSSITAGTFHACGLTAVGRAICWGRYFDINALPLPPAPIADALVFSTLSVANPYACGLVAQRLYCRERSATRFEPHADSVRFQAVSSGVGAVCALDLDGAVWCWDAEGSELRLGQQQVVRGPLPFRALSISWRQRCAIAEDDAAYCWGPSGYENAPAGGQVSAPVLGEHRFRSISASDDYTCGVAVDGSAWCWGSNHSGQFGSGNVQPQSTETPVRVSGGLRFATISTGWATTCAVSQDAAAYCWGDAKAGQVGDASPQLPPWVFERRLVPTKVANPLR